MTRNRRYINDIVWRQPTLLCQIGSKSSSHFLAQYPIGKRKKTKRRKIVRTQNVLQKQCKSSHKLVAVNICNMAHGLSLPRQRAAKENSRCFNIANQSEKDKVITFYTYSCLTYCFKRQKDEEFSISSPLLKLFELNFVLQFASRGV